MQLEIDVTDRTVVVLGTAPGIRRVVARYARAGARVTAVVEGPGGPEQPGVRYLTTPRPADPADPAAWLNLLGPAGLCVLVDLAGPARDRVSRLAGRLRVLCLTEPPAATEGRVTLLGGGPGAADLLTIRGRAALWEADVVFFDRLAPYADLATLAPAADLVDVGKRPYHHPVDQGEIERRIVDRARSGAAVVRLKGGDPFVFGRGGEEVAACTDAGIPVDVVPGVSSSIAVPGAAGIPLTHRGVSTEFTVVSGHDPLPADRLQQLARSPGTLVILMGVGTLDHLTRGLVAGGLDPHTPAVIIERGFSDRQRSTFATAATLVERARAVGASSPAVVVIGRVVRMGARPAADERGLLARTP